MSASPTGTQPDEVHDVDPEALDVTGDDRVDAWRGVKLQDVEKGTGGIAGLLRRRSRALLGDLARPHRRAVIGAGTLIAISIVSQLTVPWLIQRGIDEGLPPLLEGGSGTLRPLLTVVAGIGLATVVGAVSFNAFLVLLGRVGQDIVLDIRLRLFVHFQRLSTSYHERYTSGRVISRQTSDVEAIADLLGHGLINLLSSGLLMVGIGVALLLLDLQLALLIIAAFPVLVLLTRWFRSHAERAYRETREAVALVIVHFVESLGGIQAVHAFRREPRNQEIFEHLDGRYRDANIWSQRLGALYGPGVQGIGRLMTAIVLLYGSHLVLEGEVTIGVLAAFLLYVRRFFAPMEELSQFYNLFQAASAALEKLAGVLDEAPSVAEPVAPVPLPCAHGELRFDGVRFAYRDRAVLHHLDLVIPAGQTASSSRAPWPTTSASVDLTPPTTRSSGRRPPSAPTPSSRRCPTASPPTSTRRGRGSRPASAGSSPSHGRSLPTPPCSSSTRRPRRRTSPRSASCSTPCAPCCGSGRR